MLLRVVTSLKTTYSSPLFFSFSFFCISSIQLNSERMVRMFLTHHINQSFSCRTSMCVSYVLYIISFAFCHRGCHNITIDCQIGDFDYLITNNASTINASTYRCCQVVGMSGLGIVEMAEDL
jgi:hypothetical protein